MSYKTSFKRLIWSVLPWHGMKFVTVHLAAWRPLTSISGTCLRMFHHMSASFTIVCLTARRPSTSTSRIHLRTFHHMSVRFSIVHLSVRRFSTAHTPLYECELCDRSAARRPSTSISGIRQRIFSCLKCHWTYFSNLLTALNLILIYHRVNRIRPYKDSMVGAEAMRTLPELGTSTKKPLFKSSNSGLGQRTTLLLGIHFVALWELNLYQEAVMNARR